MWRGIALGLLSLPWCAADAIILDRTHDSRVFDETRHYRILLPPAYESSVTRYPVIYWFHGYGERYDDNSVAIATFVATHDVIVVKWDGSNGNSTRPYNVGPVETDRQFPLYFPELVSYIDAKYRTIADREHRATSGFSMGGFMSFWIAGKYPDLVSSASSFMGSPEFVVGPREFPVEYSHDVMSGNYDGVRTRLVTGSRDFIQFYHRQMNRLWSFLPAHETEDFDSEHGVPGLAKTFEFHMNAFANPLPRPTTWSHTDVYPNFSVWGWAVGTDRRKSGLTAISNASRKGFLSEVREWLPDGKLLPGVHLKFTSAGLYPPNKKIKVIIEQKAEVLRTDSDGRLHIELDGGRHSVGIGTSPLPPGDPPHLARAPLSTDFRIADHQTFRVFQHAIERQTLTLGQGNGDGRADRGEQIAVLFPDGDSYRAAELNSLDSCIDLTTRVSDNWASYDHVGASAKYTLARISKSCPENHVVRLLARVLVPDKPNRQLREFTIEIPVHR